MLNEKDTRHDSLRRIADTLRITIDDFYKTKENCRCHEQTDRMLILWNKLSTDSLREDALDAISSVIAKNVV